MLKKEKVHQQLHRLEKKSHSITISPPQGISRRHFEVRSSVGSADDTLFLHDANRSISTSLEPFENF